MKTSKSPVSTRAATTAASLTIGRLAERAGVGIDTVRYYERAGLLPAPPRRASGYRDYPADSVRRLHFIRRAKDLGFTLTEIGELLELSGPRGDTGAVRKAAQAKLDVVEHKLAELQRVRDGLQTLITACPGHGPLHDCPILQALSADDAEQQA